MLGSISSALQGKRGSLLAGAVAAVVAVGVVAPANAAPIVIPTNFGVGADAEVREGNQNHANGNWAGNNYGTSQELATRVSAVANLPIPEPAERNSLMFLKFDISNVTLSDVQSATEALVRLHVRQTGWTHARSVDPNTGVAAGFAMFGLNPNVAGQDWGETTITYSNAPGLMYDQNAATKDYNPAQVRHLVTVQAPHITAGNLPVGTAIDFASEGVRTFLEDAINAGNDTVTFLIGATQDGNSLISGSSITNYNYVFISKENATVPNQGNVDLNGDGIIEEPSPWANASNANGEFSPKLVLVPEPTSLALLGLGGLGLLRRRRA